MANAIYPKWKESVQQAAANSSLGGTVKATLVTSAYTYSSAHQFLSSVSGVVGTAQTLGSKTYTNGTFDAADVTYTAVAGGSTATAIVIYIDTGSAATSQLVAYLDTGYTNLPVTTNGGDITIQWAAGGIFTL